MCAMCGMRVWLALEGERQVGSGGSNTYYFFLIYNGGNGGRALLRLIGTLSFVGRACNGLMTRRSGCARRSAAARVLVAQQVCRPVACADGRSGAGRREGRVRPPTGERIEMTDGPGGRCECVRGVRSSGISSRAGSQSTDSEPLRNGSSLRVMYLSVAVTCVAVRSYTIYLYSHTDAILSI